MNNKFLQYPLKLLLAALLIFWAIQNLYPIEPMEYRLVEQGIFGWLTTPIFTRLFISLQFITAGLLIFNINPNKRTVKLCLLILILGFADILWENINANKIILHCYGCIDDSTWLSMTVWIVAVGLSIILLRFNGSDIRFKWIKYLIIVILLPLPFILNPVFPQDFHDSQPVLNKPLEAEFIPDTLKSKTILLAFFSAGCRYCQRAAKKISVAREKSNQFLPTLAVFGEQPESVQYFMDKSHTHLDHITIGAEPFVRLSEQRYPTLLLVKNDTIKKHWSGRTFNYGVINDLSKGAEP